MNVVEFLRVLILMILVPLLISRALIKVDIDRRLGEWKEVIIIFGFFVLILVLIGASRNSAFATPRWLLPIAIILTIRTFITGLGTALVVRRLNITEPRRITFMLFSSYKNGGLTAVTAFALFGSVAALPAVISPFFEFPAFILYRHLINRGVLRSPD